MKPKVDEIWRYETGAMDEFYIQRIEGNNVHMLNYPELDQCVSSYPMKFFDSAHWRRIKALPICSLCDSVRRDDDYICEDCRTSQILLAS